MAGRGPSPHPLIVPVTDIQYLFTALFASLLLSFSVQASPASVRPGDVDDYVDDMDIWTNATQIVSRATSYTYKIDCITFPNVCQNQCYYVNCKKGSRDIHVERTPSSRRESECAGYNRCSSGRKSGPIPDGWANNPNSGWSCDEQPKSSTREGGSGSVTRCMPAGENSAEGAFWQHFINGNTAATGKKRLVDGTAITVAVVNSTNTGYCAGKGACKGASVIPGTNNGPRQR